MEFHHCSIQIMNLNTPAEYSRHLPQSGDLHISHPHQYTLKLTVSLREPYVQSKTFYLRTQTHTGDCGVQIFTTTNHKSIKSRNQTTKNDITYEQRTLKTEVNRLRIRCSNEK